MNNIVITVTLLLSTVIGTNAGISELPIATTEAGVLDFWPTLNASCDTKGMEEHLCCLDSTFKDDSEAHHLLLQLLQNVSHRKDETRVVQMLHKSREGLEVGTRYTCYVPDRDGSEIPAFGCQRCLQEIVDEITSGMPQNVGRCRNSWALQFGNVYEPEPPWEEETSRCHLDYWFRVLPPRSTSSKTFDLRTLIRSMSSLVDR